MPLAQDASGSPRLARGLSVALCRHEDTLMKNLAPLLLVCALVSCAHAEPMSAQSAATKSVQAIDPSKVVFIVGTAHTSRPVPGVRVWVMGRNGVESEVGTTDDYGRLSVSKSTLTANEARLVLFSRSGYFTGAIRVDDPTADFYSVAERYIELAPVVVI